MKTLEFQRLLPIFPIRQINLTIFKKLFIIRHCDFLFFSLFRCRGERKISFSERKISFINSGGIKYSLKYGRKIRG